MLLGALEVVKEEDGDEEEKLIIDSITVVLGYSNNA